MPEAVYTAENKVLSPITRQFRNFSEIEIYVEEIVSSDWWYENFPSAPQSVIVEKRSSSAKFSLASENRVFIVNSPKARNAATILHELAHVATCLADGHGPIFRTAMLKLVRRYMGFHAFIDLQNQYDFEFSKGLL